MEKLKLDHSSIKSEFLNHLTLPVNNRILFTAPFGSGKSTFLSEFFLEEDEKYFTLKLFPVNYSVSQNEDVFELIKFDLLLQLMGKHSEEVNLEKEDFSTLLSSQVYIAERLKVMPVINVLLGLCGKVGKSSSELIQAFDETIDDFKAFQEEIKIDEEKELKNFLIKIEQRKGGSYEMDDISLLVFDLVNRVKQNKMESCQRRVESILIIDDLDRLDPEHTFRLFNIFTAHFDDLNLGNKFGFDKVIFVCDIENIRKLYRHKYGFDVDFKGYMDKFYSHYPFDFDNRKYLKQKIGTFLSTMNVSGSRSGEIFVLLVKSTNNYDFYYVARLVLLSLVSARALNLRTLVANTTYEFPDYLFEAYKGQLSNSDFPILLLFRLLKNFFSSNESTREKLILIDAEFNDESAEKSSELVNLNDKYFLNNLKSETIPFLLDGKQGLKQYFEKDDALVGYSTSMEAWIHYEIDPSRKKLSFLKATADSDLTSIEVKLSGYKMLLGCFNICLKLSAIR